MDFFYKNLAEICPLLSYCPDKGCLKYHPRCFSGVCINWLNKKCEKGDCCKLQHYDLKELKGKLKQTSINGFYIFNLCLDSEKCSYLEDQCYFLHKEWINKDKICIKNLDDDCEVQNCLRQHIAWDALKQHVQNNSIKFGLTTESLCLEQQNCIKIKECKGHSARLQKCCIPNFKGICKSKGKCPLIHQDWESIDEKNIDLYIQESTPTHGKKYHNLNSDDYKDKIPDQQLENIMKKFKELKNNNYFICCKITSATDKMFSIMKENFPELEVTETLTEKQLQDRILFTLNASFQHSQLVVQKKTVRIQATYFRQKVLQPKNYVQGQEILIDYYDDFKKQLENNLISGRTELEIDVDPIQIPKNEQGKFSYIFKVFDIRNNRNLIAKLPQDLVKAFSEQQDNKLLQIDPKIKQYAEESVLYRYRAAVIAQQMAQQYRIFIKRY